MLIQESRPDNLMSDSVFSLSEATNEVDRQKRLEADKAASDMEAMFLSLLLKQMRSSEQGEGLFAGDKSDLLGSMFDQYLGEHLAAAGGLGLATMMRQGGLGPEESTSGTDPARIAKMEAYEHAIRNR